MVTLLHLIKEKQVFNIETTKELSKLYYELHSVNLKIHNSDIEQEVFVKEDTLAYQNERVLLTIKLLDIVQKIGKASEML